MDSAQQQVDNRSFKKENQEKAGLIEPNSSTKIIINTLELPASKKELKRSRCQYCDKDVLKKNLARHIRDYCSKNKENTDLNKSQSLKSSANALDIENQKVDLKTSVNEEFQKKRDTKLQEKIIENHFNSNSEPSFLPKSKSHLKEKQIRRIIIPCDEEEDTDKVLEQFIEFFKDKGFAFNQERKERMQELAHSFKHCLDLEDLEKSWLENTDEGLNAVQLEYLIHEVSPEIGRMLGSYRNWKKPEEYRLLDPMYIRLQNQIFHQRTKLTLFSPYSLNSFCYVPHEIQELIKQDINSQKIPYTKIIMSESYQYSQQILDVCENLKEWVYLIERHVYRECDYWPLAKGILDFLEEKSKRKEGLMKYNYFNKAFGYVGLSTMMNDLRQYYINIRAASDDDETLLVQDGYTYNGYVLEQYYLKNKVPVGEWQLFKRNRFKTYEENRRERIQRLREKKSQEKQCQSIFSQALNQVQIQTNDLNLARDQQEQNQIKPQTFDSYQNEMNRKFLEFKERLDKDQQKKQKESRDYFKDSKLLQSSGVKSNTIQNSVAFKSTVCTSGDANEILNLNQYSELKSNDQREPLKIEWYEPTSESKVFYESDYDLNNLENSIQLTPFAQSTLRDILVYLHNINRFHETICKQSKYLDKFNFVITQIRQQVFQDYFRTKLAQYQQNAIDLLLCSQNEGLVRRIYEDNIENSDLILDASRLIPNLSNEIDFKSRIVWNYHACQRFLKDDFFDIQIVIDEIDQYFKCIFICLFFLRKLKKLLKKLLYYELGKQKFKGHQRESIYDYIRIKTQQWIKENREYKSSQRSSRKLYFYNYTVKKYSKIILRAFHPDTKFYRGEGRSIMKKYPEVCQDKIEYYKNRDKDFPNNTKWLPRIWKLTGFNTDARFDRVLVISYKDEEDQSTQNEWITLPWIDKNQQQLQALREKREFLRELCNDPEYVLTMGNYQFKKPSDIKTSKGRIKQQVQSQKESNNEEEKSPEGIIIGETVDASQNLESQEIQGTILKQTIIQFEQEQESIQEQNLIESQSHLVFNIDIESENMQVRNDNQDVSVQSVHQDHLENSVLDQEKARNFEQSSDPILQFLYQYLAQQSDSSSIDTLLEQIEARKEQLKKQEDDSILIGKDGSKE